MNVLKHRPKALELALIQAGYSLADIRGQREAHTYQEAPDGFLAEISDVQQRTLHFVAGGVLALGSLLAYETATVSAVAVSVLVAYGLHALGQVEPDPVEVQHEIERPGMLYDEVLGRLIQWTEWQEMESEERKRQQRKARQRSGGH